jgi:4-diphosphocytidyl-2-C-methyl-D-erythritol kinase
VRKSSRGKSSAGSVALIERADEEFSLPSFAKLNLILKVMGKRRDGYHSLETIFQTIDLHDRLTFRFHKQNRFELVLEMNDSQIPSDRSNLIFRACEAFNKYYPVHARVEVDVEKNIAIQSGLGGGSSNAACALIALSRYLDWPLDRRRLFAIARELGADVPFFLQGGTAFATGRGDRIRPLFDWPSASVLLVHPQITCSSSAIYRQYDDTGLLTQTSNSIKIRLDHRPGSLRDLVSHIENDLEQVVFALYPELDSIKKRLLKQGAIAAGLTGSGSAVFGLFMDPEDLEKAARYYPVSYKTHFLSRDEYSLHLGCTGRHRMMDPGRKGFARVIPSKTRRHIS